VLDDKGIAPGVDVDAIARTEQDLSGADRPPHRDLARQHQDRCPRVLNVDSPFCPAHRGNGLRGRDLKAALAVLFGGIDQYCLALLVDRRDIAALVPALQRVFRPLLGNDDETAAATQGLCRVRPLRRFASRRGLLGERSIDGKCEDHRHARHLSERSHRRFSVHVTNDASTGISPHHTVFEFQTVFRKCLLSIHGQDRGWTGLFAPNQGR
jgi:hypothetical protein